MIQKIILTIWCGLVTAAALGILYAGVTSWADHHSRPIVSRTTTVEDRPGAVSPSTSSTTPLENDSITQSMNRHWLSKINDLRAQKNLRQLVLDPRLDDTANEWAVHMGTTGVLSHDRPDGETVHDWIGKRGLVFTVRDAPGGWHVNYFTENIGRAHAASSTDSYDAALDRVLQDMLSEGSDGPHYRTIYLPDWNRFGGGYYFEPVGDGTIQIYMAFHYASLQ